MFILLAVFVASFLSVFQYVFKTKEKSQLNYWLSFLRFLSIFSILILLINPSIEKNKIEVEKARLLVAIDNSKSIKLKNQEIVVKNLVNKLKSNEDLNSKFDIHYYSFGSDLKLLDTLGFTDNYTNIIRPFREFSKIYKNGLNPIIIATDGNQTVGSSVEFLNYKNPVYPFIVGDTSTVEDIYINRLNVNRNTFINNQFPVEIFVNYTGKKNLNKSLSVFKNGRRVYSKKMNFSEDENVQIVSFHLTASESGVQYYTVKIEELENEENVINNTKNFSINVIEEKYKILVLTSTVHPDLGMLKKSIESNYQRSVSVFNIEDKSIKISDYHLVILYQPNKKFKYVFDEIEKRKLNYFIITGTNTDWKFLNSIQNIFKKEVVSVNENYNPIFNSNYASFLTNDIGFLDFAPLENEFGELKFSVPYQTLLFQKIKGIETEQPLLATFENEKQKGAILLGENAWRWRMNSSITHKSFEIFDGFIAKLIQYLASDFSSSQLTVDVNPLYFSNETIQFSANYLDKNLNSDYRAKLWLTIINEETKYLNKIPFAIVNNRFVAEISNIEAAEYTYLITIDNHKERVSGKFKVLPYEIEQQFNESNDVALIKIATKTGGKIFYNNQEDEIIDTLIKDKRYKSTQKSSIIKSPLIDWKWILGFILFLLSLEWFTRKYYGKI